jgi:dynein heavy chain
VVQFGVLRGQQPLEVLLRLMSNVYLRQVTHTDTWPETVRKEFLGYTHRFMANLSEAVYQSQGKTVLYVPEEELSGQPIAQAARDKDLTQRLESVIIHWTHQIRNVLNEHGSTRSSDSSGPLAEIDFWRFRSQDLSGITQQLDDQRVSSCAASMLLQTYASIDICHFTNVLPWCTGPSR